jgi:hypothetical protein
VLNTNPSLRSRDIEHRWLQRCNKYFEESPAGMPKSQIQKTPAERYKWPPQLFFRLHKSLNFLFSWTRGFCRLSHFSNAGVLKYWWTAGVYHFPRAAGKTPTLRLPFLSFLSPFFFLFQTWRILTPSRNSTYFCEIFLELHFFRARLSAAGSSLVLILRAVCCAFPSSSFEVRLAGRRKNMAINSPWGLDGTK